jgi:hypothetical protein
VARPDSRSGDADATSVGCGSRQRLAWDVRQRLVEARQHRLEVALSGLVRRGDKEAALRSEC